MPHSSPKDNLSQVQESERRDEQEATNKELELVREDLRLTREELEALGTSLGTHAQWAEVINKMS
jgi:hypothetical protein